MNLYLNYTNNWDNLCFRHATLRALEGESIFSIISTEYCGCDDCAKEEPKEDNDSEYDARDFKDSLIVQYEGTITYQNDKLRRLQKDLDKKELESKQKDELIQFMLSNKKTADPEDSEMEKAFEKKFKDKNFHARQEDIDRILLDRQNRIDMEEAYSRAGREHARDNMKKRGKKAYLPPKRPKTL